jgi:cytochrome c biogenesis protein CcmG/thiol:disulfide interchange protein DsbE
MAKISPLMLTPPLMFIGFATLAAFGMFRPNPDDLPSAFIGQQAPSVQHDTDVSSIPGYDQLTDMDLRSGDLTIVNFWASWCPPCRVEHPKLIELSDAGYNVVSVNFRDKTNDAQAFLSELGNPFTAIAHDPKSRIAIDWGVIAPPETFLVSGDGTILYRFIGPLVGSDYEQRFLPQLEAAKSD